MALDTVPTPTAQPFPPAAAAGGTPALTSPLASPTPGMVPPPPPPPGTQPVPPGAIQSAVGHFAEEAPKPGEEKKVEAASVMGSLDKMLGAVKIGFDKPEQILDSLRGKDAATIAAMREEFKKRMGPDANMDDWILKQQGA